MSLSRLIVSTLPIGLMVLGAGVAFGQDYPSKPIRIITGGAGGGNDFDSRQIAQGVTASLGQPVIVENRTGFLAAEAVSRASPDGYSLTVNGTSLWLAPLLQKVPYDAVRDFSPITLIERTVSILAVHPSVPVKSVKELIALAKARPGELNVAWSSTGGSNHLAAVLFKSMASIDIVGVPYKASAPVITALISGEVQLMINDVGLVVPLMKSGKLRALAVTSAERSVLVPALPTISTSGLPSYESVSMVGILAPGKTPAAIINRLNQEIVRVLSLPDVKERFLNAGIEIATSSPEQFAATMQSDIAKWGKVIKDAGIKVD